MRDEITVILCHVVEAGTKLVLEILVVQDNSVDNRLSASMVFLIESIVRKVVRSSQETAEVTNSVIDDTELIAATAAFFKREQRQCTEKRGKIGGRSRQYVKA